MGKKAYAKPTIEIYERTTKNVTLNSIRERVIMAVTESCRNFPFSEHPDLICFNVDAEEFTDFEDANEGIEPDFNEVICIVDRDWLFHYMIMTGCGNTPEKCRKFLKEEYTSEDSAEWFDNAVSDNKIAMVNFR